MTLTKTRNVCVLCLKRFGGGNNNPVFNQSLLLMSYNELGQVYLSENGADTNQSHHDSRDLYSKFLLFTGRFLKLPSSKTFLQFAEEHKNTTGENVQAFCENCQALVSYVCDLYAELQVVRLHLLKKVNDLEKVIRHSTKSVSVKLLHGLMKTAAEQINIKSARQLDLYRKGKRKVNTSTPKVLVPRGLFPQYWKFTFSATLKSLMRLIIVFTLASAKLLSDPVQDEEPGKVLKATEHQLKKRSGRGRSKRKVDFAEIKNQFNEAITKVKIGANVTIKQEEGVLDDEKIDHNVCEEDDDSDGGGFPDTGGNDNDSDWSRGPVSPSGAIDSAGSELDHVEPRKRRRLRRTRQRHPISSANIKDELDVSEEEEDPTDPEFKSKSTTLMKRPPKRPPRLRTKDATIPCKQCKKMFVDRRGLANHFRHIHKTHLDYDCDICGFKCKTRDNFIEHKRMHRCKNDFSGSKSSDHPDNSKNAAIPCPKCKRKFIDKRGLAKHMMGAHKSSLEYVCQICGHKSNSALAHMRHKSKMHRRRRGRGTYDRLNRPLENDCIECKKHFNVRAEFLEHEKSVHNRNHFRFECPMCMKQIDSDILFKRHLLTHEKDSSVLRLIYCEVCGKTFLNQGTLADHFVTVHNGTYTCLICDSKYTTPKYLRNHLEFHETDKKNFFCNFCFRGYTNEQYWQVHRNSAHAGKERIFCDYDRCTEEFNNVQELNEHLKNHLEEFIVEKPEDTAEIMQENNPQLLLGSSDSKPVEPINSQNQVTNENTTGEDRNVVNDDNEQRNKEAAYDCQIFKCTTCGWGFLDKSRLTLHELVHIPWNTDVMGYSCPQSNCSKNVKNKDLLISHYSQVHGEKLLKSYNCHECDATFSHFLWYKTHLRLHEERNSGRKFTCEICNEECLDSVFLNRHRRSHIPSKDKCESPVPECEEDEAYNMGRARGRPRSKPKTEEELAREKENAKATCQVCEASFCNGFELKAHLENKHEHEEDKPIQCNFCDLKFVHKQTLMLHVQAIHMPKLKFSCDADCCDDVFGDHMKLSEHLKQVHLEVDNGQNTNAGDIAPLGNDPQIDFEENLDGLQNEAQISQPSNDSKTVVKVKSLKYCKICDWGFANSDCHELHELCHIPKVGGAYNCPNCETPFTSIPKMTYHYSLNHGKKLKPFKCLECPSRFFSKQSLDIHIARHEKRRGMGPDEKFVCMECGKRYLDSRCFLIHLKSHNPNNHFTCPEGCGEKFVDKSRLSNHLRRKHELGEKYPCHYCGASFIYEGETRKHIEFCHEPPKFECDICHEMFRNPNILKRHKHRHHRPEGSMGFICSECGNSYKSEEGLNYHIGSLHTPDHLKKYACPYSPCPYKTHRRMLWKNHLRTCGNIKGIPYDEARFGKQNKPKSRKKKQQKVEPQT